MSFLTADDIDKKLGAKRQFKFMRSCCNQTVTGKEQRNKTKSCERAAALGLTESDVEDWLHDEDTKIAKFWDNVQQPQQHKQQDQDSTSEDEDEETGSFNDGDQDANSEKSDAVDLAMNDLTDESPSAILQDHGQNEHAYQDNIIHSQLSESHFHPDLNQAAGPSSSTLPATSNPLAGHLTEEQIRLIREAENIWHDRRLEMIAAGIPDTLENWYNCALKLIS